MWEPEERLGYVAAVNVIQQSCICYVPKFGNVLTQLSNRFLKPNLGDWLKLYIDSRGNAADCNWRASVLEGPISEPPVVFRGNSRQGVVEATVPVLMGSRCGKHSIAWNPYLGPIDIKPGFLTNASYPYDNLKTGKFYTVTALIKKLHKKSPLWDAKEVHQLQTDYIEGFEDLKTGSGKVCNVRSGNTRAADICLEDGRLVSFNYFSSSTNGPQLNFSSALEGRSLSAVYYTDDWDKLTALYVLDSPKSDSLSESHRERSAASGVDDFSSSKKRLPHPDMIDQSLMANTQRFRYTPDPETELSVSGARQCTSQHNYIPENSAQSSNSPVLKNKVQRSRGRGILLQDISHEKPGSSKFRRPSLPDTVAHSSAGSRSPFPVPSHPLLNFSPQPDTPNIPPVDISAERQLRHVPAVPKAQYAVVSPRREEGAVAPKPVAAAAAAPRLKDHAVQTDVTTEVQILRELMADQEIFSLICQKKPNVLQQLCFRGYL